MQSRALIVAISTYQRLTDIKTHQNADGVRNALETQCGYPADCIEVIPNDEATRDRILESLRKLCESSTSSDSRILFYFSGHGRLGDDSINYIFPVDARMSTYQSTAISSSDLRQCLARASNEVTVILDCCWAAGMAVSSPSASGSPALPVPAAEALVATDFSRAIDGIIQPRSDDSTRPLKRALISASGVDQRSYVVPDAPYSYFTRRLIEGLNGAGIEPPRSTEVTLEHLFSYIRRQVALDTSGQQIPHLSISSNTDGFDYLLTRHRLTLTKKYRRDILLIYDSEDLNLEKWLDTSFLPYLKNANFSFELRNRTFESEFEAYAEIEISKFTILILTEAFFNERRKAILESMSAATNAIKTRSSACVLIRREHFPYPDSFQWMEVFTAVDMSDRRASLFESTMNNLLRFLKMKIPNH